MAVSLNAINRTIAYDTRIDYYIDSHRFAGELVFSLQLPVLLPSMNECYCVVVEDGSFQCDLLKKKRWVVVAGTRNWITNMTEKRIADFAVGNADFFTSLVIAIEIKQEEIPSCTNLFSIDPVELTRLFQGMLQNALEIALYRYNEKMNGASFLTPSIDIYDRIDVGFYINFIEKRLHRCHFIPFHIPLIGASETPIDKGAFAEKVCNWRYFFSKAVYDFKTNKYLDSIIASAISVESYAWELVSSFCEDEKEIEDYTSKTEEDGNKRPLSATQLYKKLRNDNKLNTKLSKTQIVSYVQSILNPRNDIMHGKKTVAISWGEIAANVKSAIIDFYHELNEPIDEAIFQEKEPYNEDIIYRDYVLKCRNNSFESSELMKEESEKMIERFPQMDLPRIQRIKALLEMNCIEKSIEAIKLLFAEIQDPCSAAVDLCNTFVKTNKLNIGIDLFLSLKQLDIRAAIALSVLYLRDYQLNRNSMSIKMAQNIIQENQKRGWNYVLSAIIAREIAIELIDRKRVEALSRELTDAIQSDYGFPLYCAEYAIASKEYLTAISFLNICVERLYKSIHFGLKVDYYFIRYDIEDIKARLVTIISNCEQAGFTIPNNNEIKTKIEEAVQKKRTGYFIVTDINSMDKGEMPLGNLLYKDLPFVPEGYLVYK